MTMADRKTVMSWLEGLAQDDWREWHSDSEVQTTAQAALEMLKAQAKAPIHIYEEYQKHDWQTTEDGEIDIFAFEYDYHNGPVCKRCGYSYCIHCLPDGRENGPCVIDEYKCPSCERYISKGTKFCSECGQEILWDKLRAKG